MWLWLTLVLVLAAVLFLQRLPVKVHTSAFPNLKTHWMTITTIRLYQNALRDSRVTAAYLTLLPPGLASKMLVWLKLRWRPPTIIFDDLYTVAQRLAFGFFDIRDPNSLYLNSRVSTFHANFLTFSFLKLP